MSRYSDEVAITWLNILNITTRENKKKIGVWMMLHAESYYVKSVFYGNYVKEIFLPLSMINFNKRNTYGIKNTRKNEKKLTHNNIRAKSNFIRKTYHNFLITAQIHILKNQYLI